MATATRYSKEHEWVRMDDDIAVIGISDHAQEALGDIVFVELPEIDREVEAGEACATVESVKAASDVSSPIAGRIVEVNSLIVDDPGLVNREAEGEAWFFKVEPSDPEAEADLLDETEYTAFLETLD